MRKVNSSQFTVNAAKKKKDQPRGTVEWVFQHRVHRGDRGRMRRKR
jgi:hypothetical protein